MTDRSLQVTYRKGRAFSAYLYLSNRAGERSARTEPSEDGLLVVDYAPDGRPLGVEITSPQGVALERLNELLARLGQPAMAEEEFRPVRTA
jgi:hypothetical protein